MASDGYRHTHRVANPMISGLFAFEPAPVHHVAESTKPPVNGLHVRDNAADAVANPLADNRDYARHSSRPTSRLCGLAMLR